MRFHGFPLLIAVVALSTAILTYAVQVGRTGRTPFPHSTHIENELECTDCHTGAEEEDKATLPTAETCYDCHEEPAEEGDAIKAFFEERAAGEGKLRFSASVVFKDLKFSHKNHIAKGAECFDCHGNVPKGEIIRAGNPDFKHTCMDCHKMMKASTECEICHDTYRKDTPPASHKSASFPQNHGKSVKIYYFQNLPEDTCFFCHQVDYCEQCHLGNRPKWHDKPLFLRRHGEEVRLEQTTLAQSKCAVCHDKSGCQDCHMKMEPRSHTVSFKNRTHGLRARLERLTCTVCHEQNFCIHCHTSVEPISHRGQFDTSQQLHCFACHFPLRDNACWTCHKQAAGHTSLPMPSDATHAGATANSCRICHAPVPHADNGMDCTICH